MLSIDGVVQLRHFSESRCQDFPRINDPLQLLFNLRRQVG